MLSPGGIEEAVTVTAEATPLQTNTGQMAKTIESKQIQDLMLNGRNPINLALLKPGVRGGSSFNSFQPDSLTTGGFNINGSRSDENLITIDGAIATRTRSSGAIIGTVNVDTVQEIQVLTASYLPEYGRSSGGQIRFVTKSGGRDFHGDLYEFYRDEGLDANSWSRNNSPLPEQNSRARAVQLQPVRLRRRRPALSSRASSTRTGTSSSSSGRRSGSAGTARRPHARPCPRLAMRERRLQRAAEPGQPVLRPRRARPRPARPASRSRATSSRRTG